MSPMQRTRSNWNTKVKQPTLENKIFIMQKKKKKKGCLEWRRCSLLEVPRTSNQNSSRLLASSISKLASQHKQQCFFRKFPGR